MVKSEVNPEVFSLAPSPANSAKEALAASAGKQRRLRLPGQPEILSY
jgi:hypothetical protein